MNSSHLLVLNGVWVNVREHFNIDREVTLIIHVYCCGSDVFFATEPLLQNAMSIEGKQFYKAVTPMVWAYCEGVARMTVVEVDDEQGT